MKKLFTTFLMMGVALCTWAQSSLTGTLSSDGKTLTLNYEADGTELKLGPAEIKNAIGAENESFFAGVETLVFVGDFGNKDLKKIGDVVGKCTEGDNTKRVNLDLSGCTKMKSTVDATDWANGEYVFSPNSTPETLNVTATDIIHEVEKVVNPVTVTVEGTPVTYVHNEVTVVETSVYYKYNPGDLGGDTPQEGVHPSSDTDNPVSYYHKVGDDWYIYYPNYDRVTSPDVTPEEGVHPANDWASDSYYHQVDGIWYIVRPSNINNQVKLQSGYTTSYSYVDENGDTQVQNNTEGLSNENGEYYYIRYGINGNYSSQRPGNLTEYNGNYYVDATFTYEYINEKGEEKSQNDIQKLTDNDDGTYSFVYYSFLDKDGKEKNEVNAPNGMTGPDGNGKYWVNLGTKYTVVYDGETIEVAQHDVQGTAPNQTVSYTPATFSLNDENFKKAGKLSGIVFPDNENFDAIPDQVFGQSGPTDLTSATVGSNVKYIGEDAFKNTQLTSFDFPTDLKVIGGEAFHSAPLDEVNLGGCTSLVAIKYEAFEEVSAADFTFPSGSALTFIGNDAFRKSGIASLDMSMCDGITEFQHLNNLYRTFSECSALTSVILPPNLRVIPDEGDGVFSGTKNIEYLEFTGTPEYNGCDLQNGLYIGKEAFSFCYNLQTIKFSKNVEIISENAFQDAAITEIHIPASVKEIKTFAFDHCQQLAKVYFDKFDVEGVNCDGEATKLAGNEGAGGQGGGAFEECQHITDIYINTDALIECDNNAFDQDISWGAGDADANFATLHFPKENTEHYVNLGHSLTDGIVANPGLFHSWLMAHYKQAVDPHKNGWYEFINAGPDDPDAPEYQDIILRTFSDYDYSYLVPNGLRAYVVSELESLTDDTYEVTLKRIRVIPAKTGVILYGHPNGETSNGKRSLVLTPVSFAEEGEEIKLDGGQTVTAGANEGLPLCRANWDDNYVKNYLEPILSANGTNVNLKPYEKDEVTNLVAYRNFALGRYSDTDYNSGDTQLTSNIQNYVGFFRMKDRSYKSGYAYLRLTNDEYPVTTGGEILVKEDAGNPSNPEDPTNLAYYCEYEMKSGKPYNARTNLANNPEGWWIEANGYTWKESSKSWGDRTLHLQGSGNTEAAKYFGELEEDADGIVKIVIPANNTKGDFFTLQGVKVTNPTKGVYIQNGKKVIIK